MDGMHIRRIIRGLGNLPEYGPHPGIPVIIVLLSMATVAGIGGVVVTAAWSVPLLLYGAWERGKQ